MKILLVTRGSQGDVYPYLTVAAELVRRGHEVTVNLPQIFEEHARSYGLRYVLQQADDIGGMMRDGAGKTQRAGNFIQWTRDTIDKQFEQLVPLLEKHDILVATNTEFAAASVAECCGKPLIRTAYAPLIPGKKIPPPVMPFSGGPFPPAFRWKILNLFTNFMVGATLNRNRRAHGLAPVPNFGRFAAGYSHNYLMYSPCLGNTDPDWQYAWQIGGYCFNDTFRYDRRMFDELMTFIGAGDRPVLFFTLGSCSARKSDRLCRRLAGICRKHGFRLIVGAGWSGTGTGLRNDDFLCLMTKPVPHNLIFPYCTAVIHHGGSGTTHSVARAGKPQLIVPLIIDQHYWADRVKELGLGPRRVGISKDSADSLERKVCDLLTNPFYRRQASELGEKIRAESGVGNFCDYIESFDTCVR